MSAGSLPLGPFDLIGPAGAGAMGEVWRAVHRTQNVPVAIKVVTATAARAERYRALFGREVRAVARLDHGGIVRVFDHGVVPAPLAEAMHQRLPEGAPWLAMTWLGGGALRGRRGQMPWPVLRQTLLMLLDALAHAHARGLVHRDFKDGNVLFGEAGPVITDFGLALDTEAVAAGLPRRVVGTPYFMAPEIVRGDGRRIGPWTDLYALGCTAFALASGEPPFAGRTPVEVMHAQAAERRPALWARHPVPLGFEAWVHRLMAIDPARRTRCAADAAYALIRLPDGLLAAAPEAGIEAGGPPISDDPDAPQHPAEVTLLAPPVFVAVDESGWRDAPPSRLRPPMPADWRRPPGAPRPPPLSGVGRSLVALREPRLRGRQPDRDVLWAALRAVIDGDGPRAVLLTGPSGAGKTRLARWLIYRAHELGLAEGITARHGPLPEPEGGVGPMLGRALRCRGLLGEARVERIGITLDLPPDDPRPGRIAAVLDEDGSLAGARSVGGEAARLAAWITALDALAIARPLIVLLDDAQWAEDGLELVSAALERSRSPILFVLTVRDDLVVPRVGPRLAALAERQRATRLAIGRLPGAAVRRIVEDRLPLDRATADLIARRAGGSPLFAAELIQHWVDTGALVAGADGFRVRSGARESLPAGLGALWDARLDLALQGAEPWAAEILEGAAVLGMDPAPAEWARVCDAAGLPPPSAAIDALLRARLLIEGGGDGWSFAHAMVREALLERARIGGRLRRWHHLAAAALEDRPGPGRAGRRAHHLQRAGLPRQALPLFIAVAWGSWRISEDRRARRAIVSAARAAWRAGIRADDPIRAELQALWSLCARGGRAASRHARRAFAAVDRCPAPIALRVRFAWAYAGTGGSDPAETEARFSQAAEAARRLLDDPEHGPEAALLAVRCLRWQAVALARRGALDEADGCLEDAEQLIERQFVRQAALEPAEVAYTEARRAEIAQQRGDVDDAWQRAVTARDIFSAIGHRAGLGMIARQLSEIARVRGEQLAAERWLRAARRIWLELGREDAVRLVDLNLGLVLSEMGRFDEARVALNAARGPRCPAHYDVLACLLLLACDADAGDWAAWAEHWQRIEPLRSGRVVELDVAIAARLAARAAAVAGADDKAADAWRLAIDQYTRLGRAADVEAMRAERRFTPTTPLGSD